MTGKIHDVVGIGLGPFNLGLAALIDGAEKPIDAVFLEQKPEFSWHDGMLIEGVELTNSYIGDLVTLKDPTNPYSFVNYLSETDRLWDFHNYGEFFIPRKQYNEYCKWVSERLDSCRFRRQVTSLEEYGDGFLIEVRNPETDERFEYRTDNIALGVGSRPHVPENLSGHPTEDVFHSSEYLERRDRCLDADSVTIIGSGQSSAEIFRDLVQKQPDGEYRLDWLTRSDGFYGVDPSQMTREVRSPEYVDYFYNLPQETRDERLATQDLIHKGISPGTSTAIFKTLYEHSIDDEPDIGMLPTTEITDIEDLAGGDRYRLQCHQWEEDQRFTHDTEVVILATGYHRPIPSFVDPIKSNLCFDRKDRLCLEQNFELKTEGLEGRIFVQNGGMHAHGFNTANLSIGPHRNTQIINTVVGEEVYPAEDGSRFQSFSTDKFVSNSPNSERIE